MSEVATYLKQEQVSYSLSVLRETINSITKSKGVDGTALILNKLEKNITENKIDLLANASFSLLEVKEAMGGRIFSHLFAFQLVHYIKSFYGSNIPRGIKPPDRFTVSLEVYDEDIVYDKKMWLKRRAKTCAEKILDFTKEKVNLQVSYETYYNNPHLSQQGIICCIDIFWWV